MRRILRRPSLVGTALALVLASCGGNTADTTTTAPPDTAATTTSTVADTTTTTSSSTTTLPASGPPLAVQGDHNETVEALQFLLNCNGFGELTVDGAFGPATLAAVQAAQTGLGLAANGEPDDETMAGLSRGCAESRRIEGDGVITVVGNAGPLDPEIFQVALLSGTTMAVTVTRGTGLAVAVLGADGTEIPVEGQSTYQIDRTGDYVIEVSSPSGPVTFTLAVNVTTGTPGLGEWVLATNGITYRTTKLSLGDDAETVIDHIFDFLGHGIRGVYDEFDTDWYAITDPQPLGLRGIRIEGFAFLFFGPDPVYPDAPETLERIRYTGPGNDAEGNPRPDDYVTTAKGIAVGDTVADLKAAYGAAVTLGHNSNEYYYRLTDSGGELCFYFVTADAPTDFSPISEMATECRAG